MQMQVMEEVAVPGMVVETHTQLLPTDKAMAALPLRVEHLLLPRMVEVERHTAIMVLMVLHPMLRMGYVYFTTFLVVCCWPFAERLSRKGFHNHTPCTSTLRAKFKLGGI
jgi:hypothetical protein